MFSPNPLILLLCFLSVLVAAQKHPKDNIHVDKRLAPGVFDSGIKDNHMGAFQDSPSAFFVEAQRLEKNATMETIHDRSLELVGRQNCAAGYFACAAAGGCCQNDRRCCTYGYCMDTGRTCCPGGSCPSGSTCCGVSTCNPIGTQCCSDGNYCSEGNICVIYSGRHVCCTNLSCTAYISNGATFASTTTTAVRTTTRSAAPATITPPPSAATSRVISNEYETWYYTVTWWYYSYFYTTLRATSTVTYTTIYTTTTYTTEALDRADASSRFAVLSSGLTFTPPASATSLRSLFGAAATATPTPVARIDSTRGPTNTPTSTTPVSIPTAASSTVGAAGAASGLAGGWGVCVYAILGSALSLVV